MDVFPKFIIETNNELGDVLIIAKCTYHKQLAKDIKKVKCGGWWKLDKETQTFTLNGDSHDFGRAKVEDIKNCIDKGDVYTNSSCFHSIANSWNFNYSNECGEIVVLKTKM